MSRSLEIMGEACAGLTMVVKRMFGGHGFFAPNGGMFAGIVTDDAIIVKLVRGDARDELIEIGGHPWTYEGKNKSMTMQEWIVIPDSFYDDTDTLHTWLRRAHGLVPPKKLNSSKSATQGKPARAKASTVTNASRSR